MFRIDDYDGPGTYGVEWNQRQPPNHQTDVAVYSAVWTNQNCFRAPDRNFGSFTVDTDNADTLIGSFDLQFDCVGTRATVAGSFVARRL